MKRYKELEELLSVAEELGWRYEVYTEDNGYSYIELEKYSPAGEDFIMTIDCEYNNPVDTFLKNLEEYERSFDVDDHVAIWIDSRGQNGVPNSISELVEDAKEIKNMIYELWDRLSDEVCLPFC